MNVGRLIGSIVAVFVFVWLSDFLVHGLALKQTYEASADLWRSDEEMRKRLPLMFVGQLWTSVALCLLYAVGWKRHGVGAGVQCGFLIGLLSVGSLWIMYTVEPYPLNLVLAWGASWLIQPTLAGAIVGAIYKPGSTDADTATSSTS